MKRTMLVLVGLMLLSVSAESACKFNAKKEQAYRVRVAQFVAARAKQAASTPAAKQVPVPMAKAN